LAGGGRSVAILSSFHPTVQSHTTEAAGAGWNGRHPRVVNTTYTTMNGKLDEAHLQADGIPEVQVSEVSFRELAEITRKMECEDFLFVFVDGKVRHIIVVKSVKADNSVEEQEGRGEIQEEKSGMSPHEVQAV